MAGAGSDRPRDLPPEARAALTRGEKIAAIAIVREHWGLGLAEAKAEVERLEVRADPRASAEPVKDLPVAAIVALQHGDKIAAIKAVRNERRLDLKDSHDAVLAYLAANPAIRAKVDAVAAARRRRTVWRAIAIAVIAAAAIYLLLR